MPIWYHLSVTINQVEILSKGRVRQLENFYKQKDDRKLTDLAYFALFESISEESPEIQASQFAGPLIISALAGAIKQKARKRGKNR